MKKIDYFLYAYFYQIEMALNKDAKGLSTIKFQSEEANTDEELKKFFKRYLSKHNQLDSTLKFENVIINNGDVKSTISFEDLKGIYVKKVWLPQELTSEMKSDILKNKCSVYTNPDLYLEIDVDRKIYFISVELKSTKDNKIPGSSVQQVSPNEWVIFIKHSSTDVTVSCGFYINAITARLPFPDRSPRPEIAHSTIKEWNLENRVVSDKNLVYTLNPEEDEIKKKILTDWERVLCDEWLETIKRVPKGKEKWFNNTIRMFSNDLLKLIKENPNKLDELLEILNNSINKEG